MMQETTMTTPFERTQALVRTRDLLEELAAGEEIAPDTLRRRAAALLRHYPAPVDLDLSAAALPGIWAAFSAKWYE
jgi:hypothetical protein